MSVQYLSDAWIEAADALLRGAPVDPALGATAFTIETIVPDAPGGEVRYVVEFGPTIRARRSAPDESATVRLIQRYAVAAEVAAGTRSAQTAFLAADIQLGGDVSVLIGHAGLVATVGDVLAPLRADTVFAPDPSAADA